jgi:hypothetical protein
MFYPQLVQGGYGKIDIGTVGTAIPSVVVSRLLEMLFVHLWEDVAREPFKRAVFIKARFTDVTCRFWSIVCNQGIKGGQEARAVLIRNE